MQRLAGDERMLLVSGDRGGSVPETCLLISARDMLRRLRDRRAGFLPLIGLDQRHRPVGVARGAVRRARQLLEPFRPVGSANSLSQGRVKLGAPVASSGGAVLLDPGR